jgi:hypothetical protein
MRSKLFYLTMVNVMRRNVGWLREEYEYLCDNIGDLTPEAAFAALQDIVAKTQRIENRLGEYEKEIQKSETN